MKPQAPSREGGTQQIGGSERTYGRSIKKLYEFVSCILNPKFIQQWVQGCELAGGWAKVFFPDQSMNFFARYRMSLSPNLSSRISDLARWPLQCEISRRCFESSRNSIKVAFYTAGTSCGSLQCTVRAVPCPLLFQFSRHFPQLTRKGRG